MQEEVTQKTVTFVNGWGYKDGKIVTSISPKLPKDAGEENTG